METKVIVIVCKLDGEFLEKQTFSSNDPTDTEIKMSADVMDILEKHFEFED